MTDVLGDGLMGAYLYGSAVVGGLKPASDVDVLAVTDRHTLPAQRRALISGLRPLSSRKMRPAAWRPVELTIVARPDIVPWRYPPRLDFQSGEWLRSAFDAGRVRPWLSPNADVAVVLSQVRRASRPLVGPAATESLPEIPAADLRSAMTDEMHLLRADIATDTANVLLTLARIIFTLETGGFAPKDEAANWVIPRLSKAHRPMLERARDAYLGQARGTWLEQEAWRDQLPALDELFQQMAGQVERAPVVATIQPR